jgi:hypothetical protein
MTNNIKHLGEGMFEIQLFRGISKGRSVYENLKFGVRFDPKTCSLATLKGNYELRFKKDFEFNNFSIYKLWSIDINGFNISVSYSYKSKTNGEYICLRWHKK